MNIQQYNTPEEFLDDVGLFLSVKEAENNLILGIAGTSHYSKYHLFSIKENGVPVMAALMTPPHNLILTDGPEKAFRVLDDHIQKQGIEVPGLVGSTETVSRFAACTGRKFRVTMEQLIYECCEVAYTGDAAGCFRDAVKDDGSFLVDWWLGFHRDVGLTEPPETITDNVMKKIEKGNFLIWEDGQPVSMALAVGKTPSGIRIGAVYTPSEFRNHGYATSNVAALTQKMLESGNDYCFLYTDKTNPVSNSIYQKIGYKQITESQMIRFE